MDFTECLRYKLASFTHILLLKALKFIIKSYFVKNFIEIIRHNESFHKFALNRKHAI